MGGLARSNRCGRSLCYRPSDAGADFYPVLHAVDLVLEVGVSFGGDDVEEAARTRPTFIPSSASSKVYRMNPA